MHNLQRARKLSRRAVTSSYFRRCYNKDTNARFAVKSMVKEQRISYNRLLDNEVNALTCINIYQVPRVNRFIDQGISTRGDRCLILEYALAFLLPTSAVCTAWVGGTDAVFFAQFGRGMNLEKVAAG